MEGYIMKDLGITEVRGAKANISDLTEIYSNCYAKLVHKTNGG